MFALIISHDCRVFGGVCPDMSNDDEERNAKPEKYASQARQLCSASHAHAAAKAPINQRATPASAARVSSICPALQLSKMNQKEAWVAQKREE